jgi:hypothetical protein
METRKSAAEWAELVSAWEASGVSADVFASEHGIAGKTLRWWKSELAKRARDEGRRRPRRRSPLMAASSVALARVVRSGAEHSAAIGARGGVAVVVGSARIVVEHGFDGGLLCEVVRALEEAR